MNCGTPTADLLTMKLLLNSVISTPGAKFMTLKIKDFYLNTLMEKPEFLRMKLDHFPQDVIDHYHLNKKVDVNGTYAIYTRRKGYVLFIPGRVGRSTIARKEIGR